MKDQESEEILIKKLFLCAFLLSLIVFGVTAYASEGSDLQPTPIIFNNTNLIVGTPIYFDSGISNNGSSSSGGFNIKWYVNGQQLGYGGHDSISAYSTVLDGNSQFTFTPSAPGYYTVTFLVDADNNALETNELNNSISVCFEVQDKTIDLQPTTIIYKNTNLIVGAPIYFDSGISNNGNSSSGGFNVKWYVNGQQLGYGGHYSISSQSTVLDGNSQFTFTPPAPGYYTVTFVVDADNSVLETNELNNSISFSFYV